MSTPIAITIPDNIAPPNDGDIKHVEFYGENKDDYRFEYRKLEQTQLFEYLRRKEPSFHERLMTVTFKKPMLQAENSSFNFCKDVLLNRSLFCKGNIYRFLGYSESQIREKTCYLMSNNSNKEIHDLLLKFGNFDQIANLGLRAKAIGLLFSTFDKLLELAEDKVDRKPDINSDCGFMYPQFSALLRDRLEGVNYPEPSAVLVRYQGFESMLVLKEESTDVPYDDQVQFCKPMQRFACPDESIQQAMSFICIVDHSRPYTNGYLDLRLIMFLVARGVPVKFLKDLQDDYFDILRRMCKDSSSTELFLRMTGQNDRMNNAHLIDALRRSEIDKMIDYSHKAGHKPSKPPVVRTRILVPKARRVFGVCDPYDNLKNDECYFQPTLPHDERKDFADENKVVVVCNPYYHPGDIRVFKLTHEKPKYENLIDCLVLPLKAFKELRPQAFDCAGGELSGIKFFVSWDAMLIPKMNMKPCSYMPTTRESFSDVRATCSSYLNWIFSGCPRKSAKENRDEMIEYFASFTDDLPNRIDKIYAKFARRFGPSSEKCKQLSRMLYQATNLTVDRALLLESLEEFEQMEQTRPASSADEDSQNVKDEEQTRPASSADDSPTETSVLLENIEEGEIPSVERRRGEGCLCGWWHNEPPLICPGDEVWKSFDERTEKFVEEVQKENYCD